MASLTEHVMINKLGDDLDSAINFVGGDTSCVTNIMQYPTVIREQLSANNIDLTSGIILEGDSCIIKSDDNGWDVYNTEYASGKKTGLNPNTLYIRICTAVRDIEPIYIDLTPVMSEIGEADIDIDAIIREVLNTSEIRDINDNINTLNDRVEVLEQAGEEDLDYIVEQVVNSTEIKSTYIARAELDDISLETEDIDDILTI